MLKPVNESRAALVEESDAQAVIAMTDRSDWKVADRHNLSAIEGDLFPQIYDCSTCLFLNSSSRDNWLPPENGSY